MAATSESDTQSGANVNGRVDAAFDLRQALDVANIPTLVALVAHLTGNDAWLEPPYQPSRGRGIDDNDSGGLPEDVQAEIRQAAYEALTSSHGAEPDMTELGTDRLVHLLSVAMGEEVPHEYGPLIANALSGVHNGASRMRDWTGKSAIIIGAGISGLCAAVRLRQEGLPFIILDRHPDLGGSWWENRYPGVGVDTPSQLYEFSFFPYDWKHYFATGHDVYSYLHAVADHFDLHRDIRLGMSIDSITFDEQRNRWDIEACSATGEHTTLHAEIVISAVGAFNQPCLPDVPGLDRFTGPVFHTTDWQDVDLTGKRVAVIGNGASAMQVVPAIAAGVEHLTIVQRTPQWISPFERLHEPIPDSIRGLMKAFPAYRAWYGLRLLWTFMDKLHPVLTRDPDWAYPARSINSKNDGQREYFTRYIESELAERPDLIEQVLPTYPPYGKRILLDNGWYSSLLRDNVTLETSPKSELTEDTLLVNDREYPIDVVVLATGFRVVRFLSTYSVTGRDGTTLSDAWGEDDARAYYGLAVPDFPNFFVLYGPNIAPGHGGSLIPTVEAQMDYLVALLDGAHERLFDRIEVMPEAYERYNAAVDAAHERMVWTHPGMDTYYRNSEGRVVVNNPFRIIDFWTRTRSIDWHDWSIESQTTGSSRSRDDEIAS